MTTVNSSIVTDGLIAMLRDVCDFPIGDGEAPDLSGENQIAVALTAGYGVVHMVPSGGRYINEDWSGQEDGMEIIRYQLTGHGVQRNQADRISQFMIAVVVDRADGWQDGFGYIHPLPINGHEVMKRGKAGSIPTEALGSVQAGGYIDLWVMAV